jgi:glycosyltransferase involved in cell wall biosynthesis
MALEKSGNVWTLELPRSAFSIPLEKDLSFDPAYWRHLPLVEETMQDFSPDLIHITGPSDVGLLGAGFSRNWRLPLAASWHTNVHEYAGRRFKHLLRILPQTHAIGAAEVVEECAMEIARQFYSAAEIIFAPNHELCIKLERTIGRPCYLMPRGVDSELFDPQKRTRSYEDKEYVLGYVGRLSIEKNVRLLAQIQEELGSVPGLRANFLIVGHGSEEAWLRCKLPHAEFTGVLKGEKLAAAYANVDVFIFPSHTDTFGNVVLEALASGVPAVVTPDGGPASIVRDDVTGQVARDAEFAPKIASILIDPAKHQEMRKVARKSALTATWDAVFEGVYSRYMSLRRR